MTKRARRPAAETKAAILDAATRQLRQVGPAGLRLDDVAADVGISRQAVLHHFGSREALMREVVGVAWSGLFAGLMTPPDGARALTPEAFLDMVDDATRRKGNARLGAWLLLSEQGLPDAVFDGALAGLPAAVMEEAGVERRDAEFGVLLIGAALFGDALFGHRLRQSLGIDDGEEARADFRQWLAERLLGLQPDR